MRAGPAVVAALLVFAGCLGAPTSSDPAESTPDVPGATETPTAGPSTPGDRTATPTPEDPPPTPTTTPASGDPGTATPDGGSGTSIRVRGGRLPVDANATFDRLARLVNATAGPPGYVVALTEADLPSANGSRSGGPSGRSFRAAMGVVPEPNRTGSLPYRYPAATTGTGVASVYPGDKPPELVETILAHELLHYLQFREGYATELRESIRTRTTDGAFAYRSVLEGMAVYVTDAYVRRHLPNASPNSALYRRIESVLPPGTPGRYGNSWYVFGADYAAARLDSPAEIGRLVERPPTTSEQVIHGYAPGVEPPRPLSVSVATGGEWSAIGRDRKGEALLRVILQNGLPERVADRAAAGWGNDSLVTLRSGEAVGYAWTIRWDDRANATEFEAAFGRYLDARDNRSGGVPTAGENAFDLRRPSPETTVVLVGNRSFVTDSRVTGSNGSVTVSVPGSNATARNGTGARGDAPGRATAAGESPRRFVRPDLSRPRSASPRPG